MTRMAFWTIALLGIATPASPQVPTPTPSPVSGVWMVTGGGGAKGDCMSEIALDWGPYDPARLPSAQPSDVVAPSFATGGGEGRVSPGQTCVDGTACDADGTADGRCTFRVAVCLCVNDPATSNCTGTDQTRGLWCNVRPDVEPDGEHDDVALAPFAYLLRKPSRLSKDPDERRARCNLERKIRGCVLDLDTASNVPQKYARYVDSSGPLTFNNDCLAECDPQTEPDCRPCPTPYLAGGAPDDLRPQASPTPGIMSPMLLDFGDDPYDWLEALVPGESVTGVAKSPASTASKSLFLLSTEYDAVDHPHKSALHRGNESVDRFGTDPVRRCVDDPQTCASFAAHEQFVDMAAWSEAADDPDDPAHPMVCSDFAEVVVDLDGRSRKVFTLSGDFWAGSNQLGPVDKGGGDTVRLTCQSAS